MKGRMVADGRTQDRTIYNNNASPTVQTKSVMACLKIAAVEDRLMMKVDISGAFLTADIDDTQEVWLYIDSELTPLIVKWKPEFKKFVHKDGSIVCKVLKGMYGLVQAAILFYRKLTGHLERHGFQKNPLDKCVMNRTIDGKQITILIHVDDLLVLAVEVELLHSVRDILLEEFEKIEWKIANEFTYLGMLLQKVNNGFVLSMQYYIEQTLDFYTSGNADRLKTYVTPAKTDLYAEEGELVTTMAEMEKFYTTVAKLLYLGKRTRPEVLLAVQYLCTRVKNRTTGDFKKLERVLGFLKLTKKRKRFIDNSPFDRVSLYIDAAFGCYSDGKGQAGCCAMLNKTLVNEITKKLKMVTKDATDSELVALSNHVHEAMVMTKFLEAQHWGRILPILTALLLFWLPK